MKGIIKVLFLVSFIFLSEKVYAPVNDEFVAKLKLRYKLEYFRELTANYEAEQFDKFLFDLGNRESGNNPDSWNQFGYIGKYQLGKSARKSTGFEHITYCDFKTDPSIWPEWEQDVAMMKLLLKNQKHLMYAISQYSGNMIHGVVVTKSGILAAAHIAGAEGVKRYFATNGLYNPADAFGTSLETYLFMFSGYNF
jgi:hypothetical protein